MSNTQDTRDHSKPALLTEWVGTLDTVPEFPYEIRRATVGTTFIKGADQARDLDILIQMGHGRSLQTYVRLLAEQGWAPDGYYAAIADGANFASVKKVINGKEVNLLLVLDYDYFTRWLNAAKLCRALHAFGVELDRPARVLIHEMLREELDIQGSLEKARKSRQVS